MPDRPKAVSGEVFSGWKEIARYLGKAVRTTQRYESHLNLPVRRAAHKSRGAVIATKAELDAWIDALPLRHSFPLSIPLVESQHLALVNIRISVAEFHKLREQMHSLHDDLHTLTNWLHATLLHLDEGNLKKQPGKERDALDGTCSSA